MLKLKFFLCLLIATASSFALAKSTKGYVKKDGTHVAPYKSTNPNKTQRDNYSSKGNVNPYTGKKGTKVPTR